MNELKARITGGLKSIFSGADDPNYAVVVIKPYRIELWTPPGMEPEVLEIN